MGQVYTVHDIDLRDVAHLELNFFDPDGVGAGPGVSGSKPIGVKFQFPPRILSDNRRGAWEEGDLRGTEPVSVFKTSGPREIALSWQYVVDGNEFTPEVIAAQVKLVRGYFAAVRDKDERSRNLIVRFRYILYGDAVDDMSARIKSIDVKHSDTIISDPDDINVSFPLRTDINVDLRLWTKGGPGQEKTQELQELYDSLTPKWY